jgi:hypothetical protein
LLQGHKQLNQLNHDQLQLHTHYAQPHPHPRLSGSIAEGYLHMSPAPGLGSIASVIMVQSEQGGALPDQVSCCYVLLMGEELMNPSASF